MSAANLGVVVVKNDDTDAWELTNADGTRFLARGHFDAWEALDVARARHLGGRDVAWRLVDGGGFEAVAL